MGCLLEEALFRCVKRKTYPPMTNLHVLELLSRDTASSSGVGDAIDPKSIRHYQTNGCL